MLKQLGRLERTRSIIIVGFAVIWLSAYRFLCAGRIQLPGTDQE